MHRLFGSFEDNYNFLRPAVMKQLGIKAAAASRMFERARAETSRRVASRRVASRHVAWDANLSVAS